jgi:hypothetical protein
MSGGKGGSKTTETKIPEWVRAPADRNLQRAEAVQQIEYMPYTGGQVAALTPTQEAAMNNNINTAKAFGLLDPNSNLTAMSGMPTPTTYDNGMKGYGSIGLYDQALKELTARNPENMAAYNALFGNRTQFGLTGGGGGGGRFRGGASPSTPKPPGNTFTPNYDTSTWSKKQQDSHKAQISPTSTVSESDNAYRNLKPTRDYSAIKNQLAQERAAGVGNYSSPKPKSSVKKYTKTNNPRIGGRYGL